MNNLQLNKKESIALIGFMGVGKTTVGQALAKKMAFQSIDMDREIEKVFQLPTEDIFTHYGEKKFREMEKTLAIQSAMKNQHVLSLGGGAFLQNEIKETYVNHCTVIYMEMNWHYWVKRLGQLQKSRPLLQGKTTDEIQMLFNERLHLYKDHHLKVNVDGLSIEEATEKIRYRLNLLNKTKDKA